MRVVFMGTPDFAVETLQALLDSRHEVLAVFTQPDKPKGRSGKPAAPPVKELALSAGVPVFQPKKIREEENIRILESYRPDVIVVAAFGQIIPPAILTLPAYGCINVHASLLPKYRGAAPIQWAVIDGEKESGVTIMQMAEGLDTGDILQQSVVPLESNETGGSLFEKLSREGASLLLETLDGLENGTITADDCFLAGNYGSFGWIAIPTDGMPLEAGVEYPIVSNYDPTLNYKDICGSVKEFIAAIHVSDEILEANPNFKITLRLKMTNPENSEDVIQIGEDYVYTRKNLCAHEYTYECDAHCNKCYELTNEDAAHKITHVEESCYNVEHWTCDYCGGCWLDEALTLVTNSKNVQKVPAAHTIEHVEESCYNVEYWYCAACESYWADAELVVMTNSKSVIKAVATHELVHVEANAATCTENGNIEYWYCDICETVWSDAALTQITNHKSVIIPAHGIEYVEPVVPANCQEEGHNGYWYCAECNIYYGDESASYQMNPAWIFFTGDHVRPEGAADCATVACELCDEDVYGTGEHDTGVPACQTGTCSKCGEEIIGYGCVNYDTPACMDGVCYYCGGFVAGFGHENGAWAPCLDGECSYGCGLEYPATQDHVDDDSDDYCDNCWTHLNHDVDPCVGGECSICWTYVEGAHDYEYVNNGNGTHSYKCSACGDIQSTEAHSYPTVSAANASATCVCGEEVFAWMGMSVALESSLETNFVVNASLLPEGNYYALIEKEVYNKATGEITIETTRFEAADFVNYNDAGTAKKIVFTDIAAKQMADRFTVTIYNEAGEQISASYTRTMEEYLLGVLADSKTSAAKKVVCVDFLNYGAAAQDKFGYRTSELVNSQLTEDQKALATDASLVADVTDERVKGAAMVGTAVAAEYELVPTFVYQTSKIANATKAIVSYTNFKGEAVSYEIAAADFADYNTAGTAKKIEINGTAVADGASPITVQIVDANGNILDESVECVNYFAARSIADHAVFTELLKLVYSSKIAFA